MERTVIRALGLMIIVFSLAYAMPVIAALIYADISLLKDFLLAMGWNAIIGGALWFFGRHHRGELSIRQGYLLVVAMWTAMPAVAALPFLMALPGLSFTDAYFEAMSGLSTTGATVLTGLDSLSPAIHVWRHELGWLGGMGIIVLAVAVMPLLGIGGRQLFKAETPGPMKETRLAPRITETVRNLWLVYLAITLVCIASLKLAGMNWLDAICHAFSAMGLSAFSTHESSIGYFNSPVIESVLMVFMLVAAMNFATHFLSWRRKSLKPYLMDVEGLSALGLIFFSCIGIALFLWWKGLYNDFGSALRHTSFNVVSMATDCGLNNADFNSWPIFAPLWLLFLGCITASSGSAGGGIKMIRTLVLFKQAGREFIRLLHPSAVNPLKIGGQVIPNNVVFSVLGFIFLYFMSVVVLTFALLISGLDFMSAFSAVTACINNAGPGLGAVGPASNYLGLTDFQKWVCTLSMLIGRLEIFTVLILFTPQFWRR